MPRNVTRATETESIMKDNEMKQTESKTVIDWLGEARAAIEGAKSAHSYERELGRWEIAYKYYKRALRCSNQLDEQTRERIGALATETEIKVAEMEKMSSEMEPLLTEASHRLASGRGLQGSDNYKRALEKYEEGMEILARAAALAEDSGFSKPASLQSSIDETIKQIHQNKLSIFINNLSSVNRSLGDNRKKDAVDSYQSLDKTLQELTGYQYRQMSFETYNEKLFDTVLSKTADQIEGGIVLFQRKEYEKAVVIFEHTGNLCRRIHREAASRKLNGILSEADHQMDLCSRNFDQTSDVLHGKKETEDAKLYVPK